MIALSRMKNMLHADYHSTMLQKLKEEAKRCKILPAELLAAYEVAIVAEQSLLGRNFQSDIVAEFLKVDEKRDQLYRYLRAKLKCLKFSNSEAIREMFSLNANQFKTVYNSRATKLARYKKGVTYTCFALLLREYEAAICKEDADFAHLIPMFEELNAQCSKLESLRGNERAAFQKGLMLQARKKTDDIYRAICLLLENTKKIYQITSLSSKGVERIDHTQRAIDGLEKEARKSLKIRKAWREYKRKKEADLPPKNSIIEQ